MNEKGQTVVEYVLMLAVSVMIVMIISTYMKEPMARILNEYTVKVKEVIETGDIQYGSPVGGEEGGKRLQHN